MPSAIITGSSRGLGRAIALRFAADGYDVAVTYHKKDEKAERVAETIRDQGQSAITVGTDLSDPSDAERLVDSTADAFGGVDHVVNNAGIDQHLHTAELPPPRRCRPYHGHQRQLGVQRNEVGSPVPS